MHQPQSVIHHHQCHHIAWTHAGTQYRNQSTYVHKHGYTIYICIHIHGHIWACSPVDCDLPALHTKLWLTGCYRSHLRPLTVCKILDICVYIKEGSDGRQRGGVCVCQPSPCIERRWGGWGGPAEGSGRHLIKTVAARLRHLDFGSRRGLRPGKWSGWVWAWMEVLCVCVRICTVPQMGWAYVCGFQCV